MQHLHSQGAAPHEEGCSGGVPSSVAMFAKVSAAALCTAPSARGPLSAPHADASPVAAAGMCPKRSGSRQRVPASVRAATLSQAAAGAAVRAPLRRAQRRRGGPASEGRQGALAGRRPWACAVLNATLGLLAWALLAFLLKHSASYTCCARGRSLKNQGRSKIHVMMI